MIYTRYTSDGYYNQTIATWYVGIDSFLLAWGLAGNIHAFLEAGS